MRSVHRETYRPDGSPHLPEVYSAPLALINAGTGDIVDGMEATKASIINGKILGTCRGQRTWHVCREALENLRGPYISAQKVKSDKPENLSFTGVNTHS